MKKIFGFSILMGLFALSAGAEVKVVRSVTTEAVLGLGGGPKEMIQWTAADRQREEHKSEGKSSLLERMAGVDRPTITRLDKKVRWTLNPPKKTYQESPLVLPMEKASSPSSEESESSGGTDEKPTTRISKAEFKVTPLGQKKTIGAYSCEGYELRMLLETEDLQSHEKSEMRMVTTLWNTPETGAVAQLKKEEQAYAKAYAQAIGLNQDVKSDLKMLGTALVASMAGSGEKELSRALSGIPAEMKKIKGYPISTRVEWYSRDDQGVAEEAVEEQEESAEIPTDLSSAFGNLAAGLAKKKMAEKKPAVTAEGRRILAMTTEIKSITTGTIPADTFEIPAGFKKKD